MEDLRTTADLIRRLQEIDPEGTMPVFVSDSERDNEPIDLDRVMIGLLSFRRRELYSSIDKVVII